MSYPIVKGQTFATGDQVTATKLNNLVDQATFDSDVVDGSTLQVANDQLSVKDGGITAAKLESGTNGQLFIGNGSGFTKATLTAGTGVSITNASGAITVAATSNVVQMERLTAQVDSTSTTYADATGLSVDLVSGTTYVIEGWLNLVSADTSGSKVKLTGTATGSTVAGSFVFNATNGDMSVSAVGTSLPLEQTAIGAAAGNSIVQFSALIVCNGSGTLKVQYAQNSVQGGTSSIKLGSWISATTI